MGTASGVRDGQQYSASIITVMLNLYPSPENAASVFGRLGVAKSDVSSGLPVVGKVDGYGVRACDALRCNLAVVDQALVLQIEVSSLSNSFFPEGPSIERPLAGFAQHVLDVVG